MSDKKWFYAFNNQPQGPFDEAVVVDLLQRNVIHANTLVWQEGMPGWSMVQNTPLRTALAVRPAPPMMPPGVPQYASPYYQAASNAVSAQSLSQLFMAYWILLAASVPLYFIKNYLGFLTAIAAVVLFCILLYKFWQIIQDGRAQTTPGKAVGYMFIPFYNFYWNFVAIRGLAQDMNRYCQERAVPVAPISDQLALWYCILTIGNVIPYVNFVTGVANLVIQIILLNHLTKNAVAILNARQMRAG